MFAWLRSFGERKEQKTKKKDVDRHVLTQETEIGDLYYYERPIQTETDAAYPYNYNSRDWEPVNIEFIKNSAGSNRGSSTARARLEREPQTHSSRRSRRKSNRSRKESTDSSFSRAESEESYVSRGSIGFSASDIRRSFNYQVPRGEFGRGSERRWDRRDHSNPMRRSDRAYYKAPSHHQTHGRRPNSAAFNSRLTLHRYRTYNDRLEDPYRNSTHSRVRSVGRGGLREEDLIRKDLETQRQVSPLNRDSAGHSPERAKAISPGNFVEETPAPERVYRYRTPSSSGQFSTSGTNFWSPHQGRPHEVDWHTIEKIRLARRKRSFLRRYSHLVNGLHSGQLLSPRGNQDQYRRHSHTSQTIETPTNLHATNHNAAKTSTFWPTSTEKDPKQITEHGDLAEVAARLEQDSMDQSMTTMETSDHITLDNKPICKGVRMNQEDKLERRGEEILMVRHNVKIIHHVNPKLKGVNLRPIKSFRLNPKKLDKPQVRVGDDGPESDVDQGPLKRQKRREM